MQLRLDVPSGSPSRLFRAHIAFRQLFWLFSGFMNHCSALVVATFLLAACSKPSEGLKAGPDAAADVGASTGPVPPGSVTLVQIDASVPLMEVTSNVKSRKDPQYATLPVFEKLAVERADQPAGSLRADALYDAIEKEGVAVSRRRQVLAFTVGAGYCLKADAVPDIDLIVCEFDDDATLAKGKKAMLKDAYPRRELLTRKMSSISVTRLSDAKATSDAAAKISALAQKL